jgi:peptidoglycan/xylan/chitin deacetylase (PgdA/CDA1 family)
VRALRGEIPLPARPVVITFDDGYADFLASAAPMLAEYGLAATLYVTTRPIGRARRGMLAGRPMLTWAELRELAAYDVEIGAHSHDHAQLDVLPPHRVALQVTTCKQLLEDQLQQAILSFAYPHGYNSATTRQAVRAAGYTSACGVQNARSHTHDNVWSLARIMFEREQGMGRLRRACLTDADPLANAGDTLRQRMWRLARRLRVRIQPDTLTPPTTDGD